MKCPICGGTGKLQDRVHKWVMFDCPNCDGKGDVPIDKWNKYLSEGNKNEDKSD